jgi:hypothetical protein
MLKGVISRGYEATLYGISDTSTAASGRAIKYLQGGAWATLADVPMNPLHMVV